jgi:hypothetical protein
MAPQAVNAWLKDAAAKATLTDTQVAERLRKQPNDLAMLWMAVARAQVAGDDARVRALLVKIEAADQSPGRVAAVRAAWQRAQIDSKQIVGKQLKAVAEELIARHPAQGGRAASVLAASGADKKTVDAAFKKVIDACQAQPQAVQGELIAAGAFDLRCDLNQLTYDALGAGALDAALAAAQSQRQKEPDDPNPYDTLAEVYNYRHERGRAIETEKEGLAKKNLPPELAQAMQANLARFERGEPCPDVRAPSLAALLPTPDNVPERPHTPTDALRTLVEHERGTLNLACAGEAKGLEEAYLRVRAGKGVQLEKVEVLEPAASPGLRKCLEKAVRAITLPADTLPATVVFSVNLKKRERRFVPDQPASGSAP